jgi:hypothetical protein
MWTVDSLKEWHDFYVLVGTAGATLLALLFVAVSLGAGYLTEERQSGTRTFMSPVVVHFTSVFFLSAVALIPWHQARFFAALIGATALIGAIISTYITIQVVRTDMTNYMVPRCLGWIETSSRGQPHVELAGEQVDDCFEVAS